MDWNDYLRLPESALASDRRVPKAELVRKAQLTRNEQKSLERVAGLWHFATVQKSTTRVLPHIDDEHVIQSVIFLRCEMAHGSEAYAETAGLLHKCFPNPTVLLFEGDGTACISVALTRKSLAEAGATVVDSASSTGAFDARSAAYAPFLASLAFGSLPQGNLLAYTEELAWRMRLARAVPLLGFYPACEQGRKAELDASMSALDAATRELATIKATRCNGGLSMNERAQLRMRENALKEEIDRTVAETKEICNG